MGTTHRLTTRNQIALAAKQRSPVMCIIPKCRFSILSSAAEHPAIRSILFALDRDNADRRDYLRRRWQNIGTSNVE